MKTASAPLIALLNSGVPVFMADHVTLTLVDNTVLRWTTWESDLVLNTFTFSSSGPIIQRGNTRCAAGLEVDTLEVKLLTGDALTINGISYPLAAHNGIFDGARLMLERSFMAEAGTIVGSLVMFEGEVAGVDPSSTEVKLTVKSELERLNIKQPHNIFSPKCQNCLYDAMCGLNRATYTVTGTATGVPTTTIIPSALAQATDYFQLGVLVFTSGPSAGARRAVKSFSGGTIVPSIPLPVAPVAGNTFTIYPGCDHTTATCSTKFNNLGNNRSFPFVPPPETAR